MEQLANSLAGAAIDAGANILAYPGDAIWGEEISVCGRRFKMNQHFYISYMLTEDTADEYLCYVQPGFQSLIRGLRRIIMGGVVSALATPEDVAGDLGFLQDNYAAGYCREIKVAGLLRDQLIERVIAMDGVAYMVIECWKGDGHTNLILDRPLDQPVTHTSALTGGRIDAAHLYWGVNPRGLYIVFPKHREHIQPTPGVRTDTERHGVNIRETRWKEVGGERVSIDFLCGLSIDPTQCWMRK